MLSLLRVPAAASQRIHQVVGLLLRIDGFVVELAVGLFPAVVLKRVDQMGASRMDQTNNAPCELARCLFRFSRPISNVLSGGTLTTERRHVGCFASDCFGVVGPKRATRLSLRVGIDGEAACERAKVKSSGLPPSFLRSLAQSRRLCAAEGSWPATGMLPENHGR
jgi:hypothetical protein